MTYEKALKELKRQVELWHTDKDFVYELEPLETAINAIEKQIPKKPTVTTHKYRQKNTEELAEYKLTHCPYCFYIDKQLGYFDSLVDKGMKYCHRCGQALDWSESE